MSVSSFDKPCKILFLVSSMQGGGAERVAALLCNHWVEQGYQVTLMPTFSGRGECLYPLDSRVQLDFLADRVGKPGKGAFKLAHRFVTLRRFIRTEQPDKVVAFMTPVNVAALLACIGLGRQVIVSERNYPPARKYSWHWRILRRLTYPLAGTVVMQTAMGKDWMDACCHRANNVVIPNPVIWPLPSLNSAAASQAWRSERQQILAMGRLNPAKQFDLLIDVFSELSRIYPDWELVIVGEGNERKKLEAKIKELHLENQVYLPGRVTNVTQWYNQATMYVLCSKHEGFPNTLVEAMAHGLAVISFDCPTGPAEIIREGVDGLLISPEAGQAGLKQAMICLMDDVELRKNLMQEAIKVRERFSISQIGKLWEQALGIKKVT